MERNSDIREFLVSRRAKITPEQAGLPAYGTNRRVQGTTTRTNNHSTINNPSTTTSNHIPGTSNISNLTR